VFVSRTSSTPVATWFWQTEGRSEECVILGVRPSEFILSEFQSPLRRIFIGSDSLPLSGRLIGPSLLLVSGLDSRVRDGVLVVYLACSEVASLWTSDEIFNVETKHLQYKKSTIVTLKHI
jgi:hypothetical protein